MAVTTVSGRAFNQGIAQARRAARNGPVIITDRGRPAQVLMSFEAYQRLTGGLISLADALAQPGGLTQPEGADVPFDPPRLGALYEMADLS
jgi:prevent-host-death family protein